MTSGSLSRDEPAESLGEPAQSPVSERSRGVALGLAVVGGVFGLHRFYAGRPQSGIAMLVTFGGLGIWYLYDIVIVAVGDFRDCDGRRLARWEVSDAVPARLADAAGGASSRRIADMEDRMLSLESQVSELAERLDFTERLLARVRERGPLPKG